MSRACDEVWYFACNEPSSVVRLVGPWRWPDNFCMNLWTARFETKEIRTWRTSCCDAMISWSWRIELLSGGGCMGGICVRSMVEPIQRDRPLWRGSLSGRTLAYRSSRFIGLRLSEGAMSITLYVVVLPWTWVPSSYCRRVDLECD